MCKVAIVTGASSGIGLAAANALLAGGYRVYGISRHAFPEANHVHLTADITDMEAVQTAVNTVIETEGRIDLLVNNAGFGISGAVEFTESDAAKKQLDVNFFGAVNCIRAVLPHMRRANGGTIINVSSVAGAIAIPFQAFYSASKAALVSLSTALANEVKPFRIRVTALLPGDVKTGFTAARKKDAAGAEVYAALIKSVAGMEKDEENGMPPEIIARRIASIARKKRPKPTYSCGLMYQFFLLLARLLPCRIVNWLVGKLYA